MPENSLQGGGHFVVAGCKRVRPILPVRHKPQTPIGLRVARLFWRTFADPRPYQQCALRVTQSSYSIVVLAV